MKKLIQHIIVISILLFGYSYSYAQVFDSLNMRKLLLRDSLDYMDKELIINTSHNEFSPIPYKGGLMYISNKPSIGAKVAFNKVYWTSDPNFKIIDKEKQKVQAGVIVSKTITKGYTDDFTAPTSNDNDILFAYKKTRTNWNKVEQSFSDFSTDQAFAYDEYSHIIVYAKKSSRRINGKKHWELWQAMLIEDKLRQKKRLVFDDKAGDYLYPFIANNGTRLYFSSNKNGSFGGYDIYYVDKIGNSWQKTPNQLDSNINTKFDEISPDLVADSLYYSSNKTGGLGGFDIYYANLLKPQVIVNVGFPLNSDKDEVSFKKVLNQYYLSTNRAGDFDILGVEYSPIVYNIHGLLTYKVDGTPIPNHLLYLKDKDLNIIIDTIYTDNKAMYSFKGKPNRQYEFITLNGDSINQAISYYTYPNQQDLNFTISINGRSNKQKVEEEEAIWAIKEQIRKDSIAATSLESKFIVHYDFNKSLINLKEKLVLDSLLNKLQKIPNAYIVIGAFTDCIGSYKYNYQLSVKRGNAVVNYLIKNGLSKNRIVSNGYSKKYNITPCTTKYTKHNKLVQKDNRRAEIVLSNTKKTDWASLEQQRGTNYYTVYNAANKVAPSAHLATISPFVKKDTLVTTKYIVPIVVKKDTLTKAAIIPKPIAKKDTIKVAKATPLVIIKNDTLTKAAIIPKPIAKKDTIKVAKATPLVIIKKDTLTKAAIIPKPIAKKDTIKVAKATPLVIIKKDTLTKVAIIPKPIAKKDTITVAKATPLVIIKKDTLTKVAIIPKPIAKKDTITVAKATPLVIIKKDTLTKVAIIPKPIAKKDTITVAKVIKQITVIKKKDSILIAKQPLSINLDTFTTAKVNSNVKKASLFNKPILANKPTPAPIGLVANQSTYDDNDLSKFEIIKALDSLAKLKREQERIVEYLTKRINKKPIDVYVSSDSVSIEIYDNAIHDKDSVSIIYNNRIIVDRQELKVNKPIRFMLKVEKNKKYNELVMVAENLGTDPPNTAVMFVTEKSGRRQQVLLATDMTHNEVIYFIRIGKE